MSDKPVYRDASPEVTEEGRQAGDLYLRNSRHQMIAASINQLAHELHSANVAVGWWDGSERYAKTPDDIEVADKYMIPTKLSLVHSEVSEGLEGFRKNLMDDHLPSRKMVEVELADTIIRILDIAGYLNLDVGGAIIEKWYYNQVRPDHKLEARAAEGGKSV